MQGYIAGTHNVTFTNGLDVVRHGSRPPAYVARKLHLKPLDETQQPTPWSTARIVGRICKELDKMARRRADRMRLPVRGLPQDLGGYGARYVCERSTPHARSSQLAQS